MSNAVPIEQGPGIDVDDITHLIQRIREVKAMNSPKIITKTAGAKKYGLTLDEIERIREVKAMNSPKIITKTAGAKKYGLTLDEIERAIRNGSIEEVESNITGVKGITVRSVCNLLGLNEKQEATVNSDQSKNTVSVTYEEASKMLDVGIPSIKVYCASGKLIGLDGGVDIESLKSYMTQREINTKKTQKTMDDPTTKHYMIARVIEEKKTPMYASLEEAVIKAKELAVIEAGIANICVVEVVCEYHAEVKIVEVKRSGLNDQKSH